MANNGRLTGEATLEQARIVETFRQNVRFQATLVAISKSGKDVENVVVDDVRTAERVLRGRGWLTARPKLARGTAALLMSAGTGVVVAAGFATPSSFTWGIIGIGVAVVAFVICVVY